MRERRGGAEREGEVGGCKEEEKGCGMGGSGRGPFRQGDGGFWPVEQQRAGPKCTSRCDKVEGLVE